VELTEDLVESCVPGDEVAVTGVVKVLKNPQKLKKRRYFIVSSL
jgi:DNA replicative helicase MCM subunit Mcm2 (Cdc46/Mcm family)